MPQPYADVDPIPYPTTADDIREFAADMAYLGFGEDRLTEALQADEYQRAWGPDEESAPGGGCPGASDKEEEDDRCMQYSR